MILKVTKYHRRWRDFAGRIWLPISGF